MAVSVTNLSAKYGMENWFCQRKWFLVTNPYFSKLSSVGIKYKVGWGLGCKYKKRWKEKRYILAKKGLSEESVQIRWKIIYASLSLGGKFIYLGLSFMARWTVRPYFESEHGWAQEQPFFLLARGQRYFILAFEGSVPSWFIFNPAKHTGTPSLPMVKSSLYLTLIPRFSFRSIKGEMPFLRQYR